jgi:general transcriptional corepressor CYC8
MGDPEGAIDAYQQALRHNQWSVAAMNAISHILRAREKFPEAMEYLRSILKLDPNNGDVWGSLGESKPAALEQLKLISPGHCYLMMDNLQEAYTAYQQALYYLRDPKVSPVAVSNLVWLMLDQEPKLWYGIGILYDRYGSLEHAEEAFSRDLFQAWYNI